MSTVADTPATIYPYDPRRNPRQLELHSTIADEKLYGGSAGGGKSAALVAEAVQVVTKYGVPGLILRRTFPALSEIIQRLQIAIPRAIGKYNSTEHVWTFKNGGRLTLGYLRTDNDITRYVGSEYAIIAWDELTQFTEWQYRRMKHPLRVSSNHPGFQKMLDDGIKPYYVASANPGGVGHAWVKERFIDSAPPSTLWQPNATKDEPKPGTRIFVPARVQDNPFMSADYIAQLESLPEDDRRALLYGDWDVYAGQMFREFRREIHVVDPEDWPISPVVPKNIGVDYGNSAPFCALWGAWYPDDLVVIYRELYESDLTPTQQAEAILAAEEDEERNRESRRIPLYIDPSTFARGPDSPKPSRPDQAPQGSIAYDYIKAGLPVRKADNDRLKGIATVKNHLRVRGDGRPRLYIMSNCLNLIRTLPALPRDDHNPEDVNTQAEDHAYDALRYLLHSPRFQPDPDDRHIVGRKRGLEPTGVPNSITGGLRDQEF